MKSAYEIAMERADEVFTEDKDALNSLEIREELKKIMAAFFKEEIKSEELQNEFEEKERAYLNEAQLMIIESIGLRNSSEQIKRRKKAVISLEKLKDNEQSSFFEKEFTQAQSLQQQYQSQKKQLDQQVQQHLEQIESQSQGSAAAFGGGADNQNEMNAQMRQQLAQKVTEFQQNFNKRFTKVIEKMKTEIN